ncbi:MAG TPA: hypothetical protein VNA22_08055 [Pyrinomonadaceae bacterium]|nr:hypothetical protein [Pyrinomonadaceae bacterium]
MVTTTTVNKPPMSTPAADRVVYPSYKSFDEFMDIDRLRSLDSYLTQRIRRHIHDDSDDFFVNQHVLEHDAPYKPGVREVWLKRTLPGTPYDYLDINRTSLWQLTSEAAEFTMLMEFIDTLPFESTGRILLIYDEGGNAVPAHRDHEQTDVCHDFIWFRTNQRKPFYLLNPTSGEKRYVEGHSAWFDTVNQYHGSDAVDGLTFSVRVDGHFTARFRASIPYVSENAASTPSVWASAETEVSR